MLMFYSCINQEKRSVEKTGYVAQSKMISYQPEWGIVMLIFRLPKLTTFMLNLQYTTPTRESDKILTNKIFMKLYNFYSFTLKQIL